MSLALSEVIKLLARYIHVKHEGRTLYRDAVFVRMSSIATIKNHDVRSGDFVVSLGWRKEHALRLRDITIRIDPTYKVTESRLDILRYLRVIVDSRDMKGKKTRMKRAIGRLYSSRSGRARRPVGSYCCSLSD